MSGRTSHGGEIDIIDMLLTMWKRRIVVLVPCVLSIAASLYLISTKPPKVSANVQVHAVKNFENIHLQKWNAVVERLQLSQVLVDGEGQSATMNDVKRIASRIDGSALLSTFHSQLSRKTALRRAVEQISDEYKNPDLTEEQRKRLKTSIANRFSVGKIFQSNTLSDYDTMTVTITSQNIEEDLKILDVSVEIITEAINVSLEAKTADVIAVAEQVRDNAVYSTRTAQGENEISNQLLQPYALAKAPRDSQIDQLVEIRNALFFGPEKFSPVFIDLGSVSTQPIGKPIRMIVVMSFVGLLFGAMLAIIWEAITRRNKALSGN